MKSFLIFFLLITSLSLLSCGGNNTEDALRQAESDIEIGEVDRAIESCRFLTDTASHHLSSIQMCRVALIYAHASEITDNQEFLASATQCFERAVDLDASTDSLSRYIESLDVENRIVLREIRELSHVLNSPCDYTQNISDEAEDESLHSLESDPQDAPPIAQPQL